MVLPKLWEKTGSVHEGLRESKGRGRVISMYSCGGVSEFRGWRRLLEKRSWWSGGHESAESGRIEISERRRREGCIFVEELKVVGGNQS